MFRYLTTSQLSALSSENKTLSDYVEHLEMVLQSYTNTSLVLQEAMDIVNQKRLSAVISAFQSMVEEVSHIFVFFPMKTIDLGSRFAFRRSQCAKQLEIHNSQFTILDPQNSKFVNPKIVIINLKSQIANRRMGRTIPDQ